MPDNKSISLSVSNQIPEFLLEENPLFQNFMEGYYKSQEKIGGPLNIINNLTDYMNIDSYELINIDGNTTTIFDIDSESTNIQVENTDSFLDEDGTILIDDEVIYYREVKKSPAIAFSPSISYSEFQRKQVLLSNPYTQFDGVKTSFKLTANNEPVFPKNENYVIVKLYDVILIPNIDYEILNDNIIFSTAPRTFDALGEGDSSNEISIVHLKGFESSEFIVPQLVRINSNEFRLRNNNSPVIPTSDILLIVIVGGKLLLPYVDFSAYQDVIILKEDTNDIPYVSFINYTSPSIGDGCVAYSVIDDNGQLDSIIVKNGGSNYSITNTPKVSLVKGNGTNGTARCLINGIKDVVLLQSGFGYSQQNPPQLVFQSPQRPDGVSPKGFATVNREGSVESITITNSGSGYDFIPRIQFVNPYGAEVGNVSVNPDNGQIIGVEVISSGTGYSVSPNIYIDSPEAENSIQAVLRGNLNSNGELVSVSIVNPGTGYSPTNLPKVKVIQPTGAQVLDVQVDSFGRVISIQLLSGGKGYDNIPSVYIVDDRKDNIGNPIGGSGAKAVATIFNGQITDISIVEFGDGYSSAEPPKIYISEPDSAKASVSIGRGEITGFEVINKGNNYSKSEFVGCSRGVSGIVGYTEDNQAIFVSEQDSLSTTHSRGSTVKSLDSVFFSKIVDRLVTQYLPGLPKISSSKINISNILKTAKDFYASKGTQFALKYLFNVLYGVSIDISYPKDQIIKPSASVWSIDTIMRAKLISGDPQNLTNGLIEQLTDEVDQNVKFAQALIENYIAIQTPNYDVYEMILAEETILGSFTIPYKTKLSERLGTDDVIITVDSTIGWPERNGEILIGNEVIRYKEKSLTQFIECTRGIEGISQEWDSGTVCTSNFYVYVNKDTSQEVVLSVLGIVEANKTILLDDGRYYLSGDKLTISKLGSTEDTKLLDSWLYNVKKLLGVEQITFGGLSNQTATVLCTNQHGLLVGDQVTVYGANPIVFNGSFLVTSIPSRSSFTYQLPQPANLNPQGNILISIDLNKGKSDSQSINFAISNFATNVQNSFFNDTYVYVASSGIPNYKIGPFQGTALLPGNQRKLNRFPKVPTTISLKEETQPGAIGTFVNGVSAWNCKSSEKYPYGPITKINITNPGKDYDAVVPPTLIVSGNGNPASARVVVNGSVVSIDVINGGSNYISSPLVSISSGGGDGATATAIVTNGVVSRILINTPGSGFTSSPIVNIVGGGGTGATAVAVVRGPIQQVIIENSGNNYSIPPKINLTSGSGAAAEAYISNGRLTSIAVISSGSGYTTAPNVIIAGEGFGAVAKATISTEGIDSGRVTGITILNRGVGYRQGTTQIRLESIGEGAEFQSEIFQWTFNLNETTNFDYANGSIFEGYNKQFGGEYGHISNPKQMRFVLGDNLQVVNDQIIEKESSLTHSPIIGWAFDGNPIYGPYGLTDPTNINSGISQIRSGYRLKLNLIYDDILNINPVRIDGPSLLDFPAGIFIDDYEYVFRSESIFLDQYNGRFTKTPEFPDGVYAYFATINSDATPAFPYIVGPSFYSQPDKWNLNQFAIQSNIPTGIVRYRDPFENVDIDIDRQANETTNIITLEDGNFLSFEIEDLNKDGVLSVEENTIDSLLLEESKLEIFDYFPKIDVASKVDIEVETTTKFEDAKITQFLIENSGINYQVGDTLIFDNTGTDGYGTSAAISKIIGEGITNYNYRYNEQLDTYEGIITTAVQHNLEIGDKIEVLTQPQMEPVSKTIKMITIPGLEKVQVERTGIGYASSLDIPIDIEIESETGENADIVPIVSSTGVLNDIRILNSGNSFTDIPKIRISHPQIQTRSNYYAITLTSGQEISINDTLILENKEVYILGSIKTSNNDTHGFIAKFNSEGFLIWQRTLSSVQPSAEVKTCAFTSLAKDGQSIYVIGTTRPNPILSNSFNPDIIIAKYTENVSGNSASVNWQRQYGGISGASRGDYATDISIYNGNILVCGYTTTNSNHTNDAIIMYIASNGDTLTRRKITSPSTEDKFLQIKINSNNDIYLLGKSATNLYLTKANILANRVVVSWTKTLSVLDSDFDDLSLLLDEYDELYITGTQRTVSTNIANKFIVLRLNSDGVVKWSNSYTISSAQNLQAAKSSIDVFGDINVACSVTESSNIKYIITTKINYLGNVLKSNKITHIDSSYGYDVSVCTSDVSGDPTLFGNYYENRTKFLFDGSDFSDKLNQVPNLTSSGTVLINTDPKYGVNAYTISLNGRLTTTTTVSSNSWTLEGWYKYDTIPTTKIPHVISITDGSNTIIIQINCSAASPSVYGKIRTEINETAGSWSTQSDVLTSMSGTYAHIALRKTFSSNVATYTVLVNGVQYTQQTSSANINPSTVAFGSTTASQSIAMKVDDIRLSNYAIQYSGSSSIPSSQHLLYDYGFGKSYAIKLDKNSDTIRLGDIEFSNANLEIERTLYSLNSVAVESNPSSYILSSEGFQVLDFTDVLSFLDQNTQTISATLDTWSSRTATIPSPGGRKPILSAKSYDKFFFKVFNTSKVDNVRRLTLNQSFNFNEGATLTQKNSSGVSIATAKIISVDLPNNQMLVSSVNGTLQLNTGSLESSDESLNEISTYLFANIDATTPGTFVLNIPEELDAIFKEYSDDDYQVRIDEVISGSVYSRGSVYVLGSSFFSFTSNRKQLTISGLTAVTQISLITNLKKILEISSINNTNTLFVRSSTSHYLNSGEIIFLDSSPEYSNSNGTYYVSQVLNKREFLFDIKSVPGSIIGAGTAFNVYVKHPIIRLIYGQQYTFDTSDLSNLGHFLSFYRDNLNKIEYTFKNIVRKGTPGIDEPGSSPFISFKVTDDASNISYYADPAASVGENPVGENSYIDVLPSPYIGTFEIKELGGATITTGANQVIFPIPFEPEKAAVAALSSYTTTSKKAVGSIGSIRLINGGGFYTKLPIITGIESIRKIERVEIEDPGTEYQAGQYFGVQISGDGTGGRVSITVDANTDPAGQIVEVVVTDPGKGYTTAFIDIDAIPGILGPQLSGSGAALNVIIPPRGSGASIFVRGNSVGKIKKLKNNNFGFDYTHDYTLRPEITFPVNLQLTSTSVLSSIKVIDPGTGYTSPPDVVITGGGGSGAQAEAILRNGRINAILIKNPGFGYTTEPVVELKSSFTYVVNIDLQLFQFAFPHGIPNGAEVKFDIRNLGEGAEYPLTSFGFINPNQTYYAISGASSGLENDQLRIGLTPGDAATGNFISFVNNGTGRQIVLTDSFGGKAESVLETARFLSGEVVFQGPSLENATAIGTVSNNDGWQIGPRLLKLIDYTGNFEIGQSVSGSISKASGTIGDISIAKGILEVDSITQTTGKFLDDVGKLSEIVQRVQDSYLYQAFSYNIKSPISIEEWKNVVIDNVHPAGFKIFGEIGLTGEDRGLTNRTDFELVKSVNLIESSVVSHIDNFALAEPIYSEFDNTQVLFRNKRLTSSEEILTSIVQKIDDISNLFDGERRVFPLTIDGNIAVAQTSQFMITINGVVQAPGTSFNVQQGNIVFNEPPPAPTRISYATVELQFQQTSLITLTNISGIIPEIGNTIRGLSSNATATVSSSTSTTLTVFNIQGTFLETETLISAATGLNANVVSIDGISNTNIYRFQEKITNLRKETAVIEEINLDQESNVLTNTIVISKSSGTYDSPSGLLNIRIDDFIISAQTGIVARVLALSPYTDPNVYIVINSEYSFSGDFQVGEIVSGSTSGATGEVIFWNPQIKRLILRSISGTFVFNEIIVGQTTTANHKILTVVKIDPVSSVSISDPSKFYGLLFNRIINPLNPNTIVDDISVSVAEVVDIDDSSIKAENIFADFEEIENTLLNYTNPTANLLENEFIQNLKIFYTNQSGHFDVDESIEVRKLTYYDLSGGNFQIGDTILGSVSGASANVIGINYAIRTIYIGEKTGNFNLGETFADGSVSAKVSTYFTVPFDVKQINTTSRVITTDQIYADSHHRFRDAANLLRLNAAYIVDEAAGRLKNRYPDLLIPGDSSSSTDGTSRCKLDLSLLLQAVISDIENGGNYDSITAGRFYLDSNGGLRFIERQVLQSVYAHTQMNELCQQAIIGQLSETPQYTNRFPIPPIDISYDSGDCADVRSQIDTLWNSINDTISPTGQVFRDSGDLIWFNRNFIADESIAYVDDQFTYTLNGVQYRAFSYPDGSSATCKRDLVQYILPSIISDLISGGDSNTINAIKFYVGSGNNIEYIKNELLPTVVALEKANQLCQYAINNWIITGTTEYTSQYEITTSRYKDLSITLDDGTYGGQCADIKSAIDVLFQKAIDILIPTSQTKRDAAKLVMFNKLYIQNESLQRTLNNYPGFTVPGGNAKCIRDIGYIVDAIVYDLLTDGTSSIYESTIAYIDSTTGTITSLDGELIQSIYAYQQVRELMKQSVAETLQSPSSAAGFFAYTDNSISITGGNLTTIQSFIDDNMSILLGTLNNSSYIETNSIVPSNSVSIPNIVYPVRSPITPVKGGLRSGDYIYGITSEEYGEVASISSNRANVKTILKRFTINFANASETFEVNQTLTILGQPTRICKVYSIYYSETINYIDVQIQSGPFNVNNVLLNSDNFTATITAIDNRIQLTELMGTFTNGDYIRAPRSNTESVVSYYARTSSPVFSTTGGKLSLDTESLIDKFHVSNVVYSSVSNIYIDALGFEGTQVSIGSLIKSTNIYRLQIDLPNEEAELFVAGEKIVNIDDNLPQGKEALVLKYEEVGSQKYLYISNILDDDIFEIGESIAYIEGSNQYPSGFATVTSVLVQPSLAYGYVERIIQIGSVYRLYLSGVTGSFSQYSEIISDNYRSAISNVTEIVGRISRSFRGFDGIQTTFKLTSNNGIPYFPDADGYVLVYVNGILQPASISYNTFSDFIQFLEPPELGASFHATYLGKLRKLDDISFDFDSLRSSFNLKLNEVFYSLTITDGVQSTNIRPENNIIVSLNGVIQEPGVAFEIVGSRINFAEVPRAGSTFVAYSYIGSDADVIAATIVPPIESGDQLEIESEDRDRTVAVVESSNSLITFDYLGSVFGRNASALANLITGRIRSVQLTSGGDGYTSTPTVSLSSSTGFDGQVRAQVGISRVDVVDRGSNYAYPEIDVLTEIPDVDVETSTFDSSSSTFDLSFITFDAS
jgi:hypothetical protein